jgi:SAM-dependent methyltransferase
MPTLSPGSGSFSPSASHRARDMAESFGTDPDRYDRTRPGYPQELVDRIIGASRRSRVLDVGIGTGISARPFRAAGCQVVGIDADERMAEFSRRDGFEVEVARFEEWEPAGRSFDIVVAGQAWHWIDPVAGATKAADVLVAGGRLALLWNVVQFPPDLGEAFADVYRTVLPDSPFSGGGTSGGIAAYAGQFTKATEGIDHVGLFDTVEQWRLDWERTYTKEEWLDQVPTSGGHSRFPPVKLRELLAGIEGAIEVVGGSFTATYATVTVTAARAGSGRGGRS